MRSISTVRHSCWSYHDNCGRQTSNFPHVSFKDSRSLGPKMDSVRKLSQALSIKNVPEVIWEDTGSHRSQSTSSKTSSSSEDLHEVMDDSSTAWLLGQSSPTGPEANLPQALSLQSASGKAMTKMITRLPAEYSSACSKSQHKKWQKCWESFQRNLTRIRQEQMHNHQ